MMIHHHKIIRSFLSLFLLSIGLTLSAQTDSTDLTKYVNPIIGTKGILIYGRTTPFVTPPFGMTQWTPASFNCKIGRPLYNYLWHSIIGFRGSHKPAMCMGDYGWVSLMPVAGSKAKFKTSHHSHYSHKHEISKPYYYSVELNRNTKKKVNVEITSTSRAGLFRIVFPKNTEHNIFTEASQEAGGWIKIDSANREITGWNRDLQSQSISPKLPNFRGYFVIKFNCDITDYGTWVQNIISPKNTLQSGIECGARVTLAADTVMVKIGTSFISIDQARENLQKEIPQWDFDKVEHESLVEWNKYLNRIEIETTDKNEKPILYTGLYHSLLFPRQFSEYGRYYSAFDDKVHNGISYNDYSLWDTYRAEHPLLLFLTPELVPGMIQSLLQMFEEGGYMPKWPNPSYTGIMIGTHADAVVADAVVKGVKGFDLQKAWLACRKDAMVPPDGDSIKWWGDRDPWTSYEARAGLSWYMKLGYVPVDKTAESVANTLEGAYDDFCVAQVAKAVGKTDEYDYLMKRSQNFHNVFNPATGFMAPRFSNGQWSPNTHAGFTEGSPWTYLFCAMQDVPGLVTLLGGPKKFVQKLDMNFKGLHYVHENEPGHHYTYLYDYAGAAWKTQMRVAHYRTVKYRNKPQGLTGDDDCGQMSAWYTFSALGFYPVTPGTDIYAIGTPLYPKATMYFDPNDRNKKFVIVANNISKKNIYVQSVTVNGKKLDTPFLHHSDIINGGEMIFEMGPKPKK